jgi:PEP-CTERM motif-containing protein
MNRKHLLSVGVGAAVVALASQASATTVTFASFGGSSPLYDVPPGETLYTDFSSGLPSGAAGDGALYGPNYGTACFNSAPNCVAAPGIAAGISPSSLTAGRFFAVIPGQTETFTFGYTVSDVSVYIGSLDDENSLTINYSNGTSKTYTGDDLAAVSGQSTPIPGGNDTIYGTMTNGYWTFTDPSLDIVGITVSEGSAISSNSFEIAEITTSVPEPSTWAMMIAGFAGLGLAAFRARRSAVAVA